uniref:protein-serine/threonine phosphatase n=1 Tax=Aegilops tauschii subsp. strangulata TaxID=200361 RepID=A0A453AUM1_AEGTS
AADLVDAAGPGPFHVFGKGEEGGGGAPGDGAAVVGDALGRGLRDVRRRVLPPRREGHQPGHLHRMGGYGCQDDTIFCGVFDGHGQWGHYVAKAVRESLPQSLLCRWQEAVALASLIDGEKRISDCQFDLLRQSYLDVAAAVDKELCRSRRLDAVNSGCTALSIVKQGDLVVVANVGDSRAVLATTSDDGDVTAVQLTVDFKPDLPQEKARIMQCEGRVHCLDDEPGVHRVWVPHREAPGLAMSRASGDYCVKDHGVISAPEVTQRRITARDQFVILAMATDGVSDRFSHSHKVFL